jgi:hypothetical protein
VLYIDCPDVNWLLLRVLRVRNRVCLYYNCTPSTPVKLLTCLEAFSPLSPNNQKGRRTGASNSFYPLFLKKNFQFIFIPVRRHCVYARVRLSKGAFFLNNQQDRVGNSQSFKIGVGSRSQWNKMDRWILGQISFAFGFFKVRFVIYPFQSFLVTLIHFLPPGRTSSSGGQGNRNFP